MIDTELQQKRLIAAAIDFGIAFGLYVVFWIVAVIVGLGAGMASHASDSAAVGGVAMYLPRLVSFVGSLLSLGYVLGRDVLGGERSLGKKFQDIRLITLDGHPINFMDSAKRNAIFAIGSALGLLSATLHLIPCLGDVVACLILPLVILGGLLGVAAVVIEIIKILQEPAGIRFGDLWAETRVVK
jgi:uncharacterized RDD family membrane protein YckC